jgi:hypothetical protein
MNLELIRTYFPEGTNGILLLNGAAICSTIELPWKNNQSRISCIPEGSYKLMKRYSPHFKWHLEVKDVPGRQLILVHPANDAIAELKGCIAPVCVLTGVGKGNFSKIAFKKITSLLFPVIENGSGIFLTIKNISNETNNHPASGANPSFF